MSAAWWSKSQQRFVPLEEMPTPHLVRAFALLNRGEYAPPEDLSVGEENALREAFDEAFSARGVHSDGSPIDGPGGA